MLKFQCVDEIPIHLGPLYFYLPNWTTQSLLCDWFPVFPSSDFPSVCNLRALGTD